MVKRFFFDGIDIYRNRPAVNQASKFALNVHAGPALSALSRFDGAGLGAEKAFDYDGLPVVPGFLEIGSRFVARTAVRAGLRCRYPVACLMRGSEIHGLIDGIGAVRGTGVPYGGCIDGRASRQ